MADPTPAPPASDGRWPLSPLTPRERHQRRTVVRQLRRGRLDSCRLTVDTQPANATMTLAYAARDGGLALDVTVSEDAFDRASIANERYDGGWAVTIDAAPEFLRDLGPCWRDLEADRITASRTARGLPATAATLEPYMGGPAGLQCTTVPTGVLRRRLRWLGFAAHRGIAVTSRPEMGCASALGATCGTGAVHPEPAQGVPATRLSTAEQSHLTQVSRSLNKRAYRC